MQRISLPCFQLPMPCFMAWVGLIVVSHVGVTQAQITDNGTTKGPLRQAHMTTANGTPYGVGQVDLPLELATENGWHSDQSLEVTGSNCKIWLTTCAIVDDAEPAAVSEPNHSITSNKLLCVHFLFSGTEPRVVEIHISGKRRFTVHSADSKVQHSELLQRWWKALRDQRGGSSTIQELTDDFLLAIGTHLGMPPKLRPASKKEHASELEEQFERTLGMLLGFESVRLAMMIDDVPEPIGSAPATNLLPTPVNVISQTIAHSTPLTKEIEPIAWLVPNDCFYLRCGSTNNYMWLRRFLISWGGSLDEIVTNKTLDTDVRSRIENQLGINSQAWRDMDSSISDMAVIGSDVFFTEGAGIGILFEAKPGQEPKLEAIIQQQRTENAKRLGATLHSETVTNHTVSLFRTTDNRMRSFFVRHGRYLLVTNSKSMLKSVISPQSAARSLASLREYRHAVSSSPLEKTGITLYLSDPFIRRLTRPAFRIELGRRRASARECRQLEVAAIVAKALGKPSDSKPALIAGNFLPKDFGLRPDGSHVELQSDGAFDSLRGKAGTFIPVADIADTKVTKANQSELLAYERFSHRYRAEWPAMDPVLVSMTSSTVSDNIERVRIRIHITPYARNEYSFLTRYLSQPSRVHAGLSDDELMGVSVCLRSQFQDLHGYIGIRDIEMPFRIQQGELLRTDGLSLGFAEQQSFAAVTPSGMDGLQAISGMMQSLQNRKVNVPTQTRPQTSLGISPFSTDSIAGLFFLSGELIGRGLLGVAKLHFTYEDDQWSIYGGSAELRKDVRNSLVIQQLDAPSQLLLRVGDANRSQIAPYLHAYSFCHSRQQSAEIAAWLNAWSIGLRADPKTFREGVEHALQGELKCPLGGEYRLAEQPALWSSTKWENSSLASVAQVPADYRLPFLDWLRGVELKFNLTSASLNSDVVLQVARLIDDRSPPLELREFANPGANIATLPETLPETAGSSRAKETPMRTLTQRLSTRKAQGLTNTTFSSSGQQILVGGFGRTAYIFDARNLRELQTLLGHQNTIWTVALSPDGQTAVTGSEDKTLRIWNTNTGQELQRVNADGIYSCVRFSPNGKSIFATNWDGKVRIIDVSNLRIKTVINFGQPTLDIAIFTDGKRFVVSTPSGDIALYDISTNQILKKFIQHTATVHSVALFSDGKHFLSASHDNTLRLWDVEKGTTTTVYRGHTAAVHEVRLAANESEFVSCSADGTVRSWKIDSESPQVTSVIGIDVRGISIAPDGQTIAAASMDGRLITLSMSPRPPRVKDSPTTARE